MVAVVAYLCFTLLAKSPDDMGLALDTLADLSKLTDLLRRD